MVEKKIGTFGVVLIVLGIIAGLYTVTTTHFFGLFSVISTPYGAFMVPLIIIGVIVVVFSLSSKKRAVEDTSEKIEVETETKKTVFRKKEGKFCSECGAKILESAKFCKKCGTKQ